MNVSGLVQKALLVVLPTLGLGCASIQPSVRYQSFGDADPVHDAEVAERYEAAEDAPPPSSDEIRVLVDTLPQGITSDATGFRVDEGFEHQILGKFAAEPGPGGLITLFTFPDYRTGGFKPYCYPQTVLNYATLTLWSVLVPLAYPCWGDPSQTPVEAVQLARQVAKSAGGDMAVVGYVSSGESIYAVVGLILKADPRYRNAPAKPGKLQVPAEQVQSMLREQRELQQKQKQKPVVALGAPSSG